jgi:hypothetical protein
MLVAEMRLPRDAAFKRFVHYAPFVRHLLRAHPLPGLDEARVVRIEQARANLVGPDLSQRLADGAWRLTLRDGELVYLLLECQSEPDPAMPLRMLHAVATLYLALSRNPPVGRGYSAARVPRIKHLTVYSGRRPWTAAADVAELVAAGEAGRGRDVPRMACPVLNLRRWPDPGGDGNLAVLLARLQRCDDPEALRRAAAPLRRWVANPAHAERASAFATWITHVLLPDLGVADALLSDNLEEVLDMLETEPRTWADRMRDEGREQGLQAGREEGLARERKLLLRLARVRFGGALVGSLPSLLEGIADTDRLEEIGEWLLVCDTGEALLARLRQV